MRSPRPFASALATVATCGGGLALVLARAGGPEVLMRPDAAREVAFVHASRRDEARARHQPRPLVASRAGQAAPAQAAPAQGAPGDGQGRGAPAQDGAPSQPGVPNDVPVNGPNLAAARARLAPGDAPWSMTSTAAPGLTSGSTAAGGSSAQALSPSGSPMGGGFSTSYARTPTWTPSGASGGTFGAVTVAPSFVMSFGR